MDITDLSIADGEIKSLSSTAGRLVVELSDWQEKVWKITFCNVVAFESFSVEGEDLLEVRIHDSDEFLDRVCDREKDVLVSYRCISFYSGWDDTVLLKVIADSWDVQSI